MRRFFIADNNEIRTSWGEVLIIILLAMVPLFITFPYRVNIFLSWEGAYRMSQGELPYRDFGIPMGYMYWVVPAFFFKIFGTHMITLVKAQVFLNIISGLAFRSILKTIAVDRAIRFIAVFLFCTSYSFFNFWPWYNHTVIVYELVGLAFIMRYLYSGNKYRWISGIAGALFMAFSFMTKQDAGAMAFMLGAALVFYHSLNSGKWKDFVLYILSFVLILSLMILPFTAYGFGYWFNHGQPPHTARVSLFEIVDDFFYSSQWIKFYLFLIILLMVTSFRSIKELYNQRETMLFLLLTTGMLAEATILQVTSYTPPDNNIFYHSFAFIFILTLLCKKLNINVRRPAIFFTVLLGTGLWWSGVYWKYMQRVAEKMLPQETATVSASGENIVNRRTYVLRHDTLELPMSKWVFSSLPSFEKIYMPEQTVNGINRLMNMDIVKTGKAKNVLNMTELTPLAVEMPFQLEKGNDYPLWYHLGVSMFNREAAIFEEKIKSGRYDMVLFEYIPNLNNFYPFRIRNILQQYYTKADNFLAPRRDTETAGTIEVYIRKNTQ